MRFGLAFNYVLGRTGGFANLLLLAVCGFIPVVGPIVALGYRAEVAQTLLRDDERRRHPKFDFNLFAEYLGRGIWPFVMGLIVGMVGAFAVFVSFFLAFVAATFDPIAGLIVGILGYTASIFLIVAVSAPMQFHAELAGKLDFAAAFQFAKSFWFTVGAQAILAWLIFLPLSMFVVILGLLLCVVGVYPAAALVQMAGLHLMVQLYDEYLDRGGDPIREYEPPEEEDERRSRRRRRRDEEDDDRY